MITTATATPGASAPAETEEDGQSTGFISSLPIILWHRRWVILVPLLVATVVGLLAAYLIHPIYRSSATILIEAPQVPEDLLNLDSPVNDRISQRVARARERVLSRMDLIRLIRTYNLYTNEQRMMPLSKIIDKMKSDTKIGAAETGFSIPGAKKGLGTNSIAITVAFEYDDPVKAQAVAQQFVNRFLEVDASTQASQANDAVNFLTEQANQIGAKISEIENRVTQTKAENGALLTMGQGGGNSVSELSRLDAQITTLDAENARLAATPLPVRDESGVAQAEAQLRTLQARYSDSHPDVIQARAQLEAAKRAAAASPTSGNPATAVQAQIAANRQRIVALERARASIEGSSSMSSAARARAPALNSELEIMEKQADMLREQARGVGAKLQAAQIQARMENEQKGERLALADPPVVPDSPIWPNRPALVLGSIVGGLCGGLGLALLLELLLRPIRGIAGLKAALGEAPLALIPDLDHKPGRIVRMLERRARRKQVRV